MIQKHRLNTISKIVFLIFLGLVLLFSSLVHANAAQSTEARLLADSYVIKKAEKTIEYGTQTGEMIELIQSQYPLGYVLDIKQQHRTDASASFIVEIDFDFLAKQEEMNNIPPIAEFIFHFEDTMAPIIEAKDSITLSIGDTYSPDLLEIKAYDVIDGNLAYEVSGDVNTNIAGEYSITVSATDGHGLQTTKECKVSVQEKTLVSAVQGHSYTPIQNYEMIDANTYKVRGKIVKLVNSPSMSVVYGWLNQIQGIPEIFLSCVSYFEINGGSLMDACQTWDVPLIAACTYRVDNHIVLHGNWLTYNALHETLHAYDNVHGVSNTLVAEGAYRAEMYSIPKQYGNRLNEREFFVNAALVYLSNPASLQASCPQTFAIIARYF